MTSDPIFCHERLDAYKLALSFVCRVEELIASFAFSAAVVDHLDRASESTVENIVNGNSSWSDDAKRRYFGIAYGSALECAACLDICQVKKMVSLEVLQSEKNKLRRVVQMLVGLIGSQEREVREAVESWGHNRNGITNVFFDHERLDVYRLALEFVCWVDGVINGQDFSRRRTKTLDILSTSIVLNIAEGNGRIGFQDHRQFIDIAHRSALKNAVVIDLMISKNELDTDTGKIGKRMLSRIVKMALAMRGYLKTDTPK